MNDAHETLLISRLDALCTEEQREELMSVGDSLHAGATRDAALDRGAKESAEEVRKRQAQIAEDDGEAEPRPETGIDSDASNPAAEPAPSEDEEGHDDEDEDEDEDSIIPSGMPPEGSP